jgi:hypothetical protein
MKMMRGRFVALLVAMGATAGVDACGDVTAVRAQFENFGDSLALHAMNGSPPSLAAAVLIRGAAAVPITSDFNFDVAVDLDDTGAVVLHTVKAVASEFIAAHRVGLNTTSDAFESVLRSPTSGFVYDSSLTVPIGRTILVDVIDPSCSAFSFLGQNIRGKLVVDSVKVAERRIFMRAFVDPNCGFRSLAPGTPKE